MFVPARHADAACRPDRWSQPFAALAAAGREAPAAHRSFAQRDRAAHRSPMEPCAREDQVHDSPATDERSRSSQARRRSPTLFRRRALLVEVRTAHSPGRTDAPPSPHRRQTLGPGKAQRRRRPPRRAPARRARSPFRRRSGSPEEPGWLAATSSTHRYTEPGPSAVTRDLLRALRRWACDRPHSGASKPALQALYLNRDRQHVVPRCERRPREEGPEARAHHRGPRSTLRWKIEADRVETEVAAERS